MIQQQQIEENSQSTSSLAKYEQLPNSYADFFFMGKIQTLMKFQMGKLQSISIFTVRLGYLVQLFITCLVITSTNIQNQLISVVFPAIEIQIIYRIFQGMIILFKIFLTKIIFNQLLYSERKSTFDKFNMKVISHMLLISEIDLFISAALLIINNQENIFNFILSSAFRIFVAIYLQNYINRRDYLYLTSQVTNIIFRGFYIIGSLLNSILILTTNNDQSLIILFIYNVIFWIWILIYGIELYAHHFTKNMILVITSFLGMISYLLAECIFLNAPFFAVTQFSKYILLEVILFIFLKSSMINKKFNKFNHELGKEDKQHMREVYLFISSMYERYLQDKDMQALLIGIFSQHQQKKCQNSACYSLLKTIYDPVLMTQVSLASLSVGEQRSNQSSFRFYLRCFYERILSEHQKKDKNELINYCEFLYTEFGNPFVIEVILVKILHLDLNIFERLKVQRMRLALKQQTETLNHQLYQGKLYLEHVIESQAILEQITNGIRGYLFKSISIWNEIKGNEIKMTNIFRSIDQNFQLIEKINGKWKKISIYLELNRYWKFIYMNYVHFILNERIKHKQILGYRKEEKAASTAMEFRIFECQKDLDYIDESLLFHKQTLYINAVMINRELMINKVSKNCKKYLENSEHYFIGNEVKVLLPPQIRDTHTEKVINFLQKGYLNNQDFYKPQLTKCEVNRNKQISVVKFYKFYINESNCLELVALLKINQKLVNASSNEEKEEEENSISKLKESYIHPKNFHLKYIQAGQQENSSPQISNIFLKEQGFMPCSNLDELTHIKLIIRLFTLIIVGSIIMLIILTRGDAVSVISYSNQYINFMNMYRYPVSLGVNYMKLFLSIGNKSDTQNQINSATMALEKFESQSSTILTLYDQTINLPNTYLPFRNNSLNKGLAYDQVDLFYLIFSDITTLNNLSFNSTSYDFVQYNSYIKPSYDTLMNKTKNNFHSSFGLLFYQIQMEQVAVTVVQLFIFLIVTTFSLYKIKVFHNKMRMIMQILLELSPVDISKIMSYQDKISILFYKFQLQISVLSQQECEKKQQRHLQSLKETKTMTIKGESQAVLNNKAKQIAQQKQQKIKIIKLYIFVIVTMVCIITAVISIQILTYVSVQDLITFEEAGFFFLQYFPSASFVSYGCVQKYYSLNYPNQVQFDPERYADSISSMEIFSNRPYIGEVVDTNSEYYQKQKNYFYGNPCSYNPSVIASLGLNEEQCMELSNRTFTQGLSAFIRYGLQEARPYIQGNSNMSVLDITEFTTSASVLSLYILDAISTWNEQFQIKMEVIQNTNSYISIGIAISIVFLHIVLYETFLMSGLTKTFKFISKVYTNFMPQEVILKQKIIAQKFIKMKFFRQCKN